MSNFAMNPTGLRKWAAHIREDADRKAKSLERLADEIEAEDKERAAAAVVVQPKVSRVRA